MADKEHIDDLKERYARYEQHYEGLYAEMREAEKYYRGKFEIVKPKEVAAVIPPTAYTKVQTAITEMITDQPKVRRRRNEGDTEAEKRRNDLIEAALQAFLLDCEEYLQTPLLHELGNLQMRRGMAITYGPLYNKRQRRLYYDSLDPLNVYLEPGQWPREAFIHLTMPSAEMEQLAERYPKLRDYDPGSRHETEEVTLIQWYKAPPVPEEGEKLVSGRYAAWIKDDKNHIAKPQPSGYPFLPLDSIYTGWGLRTLGAKVVDIAVGLIHPGTRPLLTAEAEMFTLLTSAAGYETWGRYYTEQGQVAPTDFKIDYAPGSVTRDVPPGGLHLFSSQPLSPAVADHFARLYQMLQEAFFSAVLSGMPPTGQRAATAFAILTGNSRKKFYLPMRMLQAGVSRMLYRLGTMMEFLSEVEGFEQVLEFRGNKISHSMYGGDYSVEVDLMAPDIQEQRVRVAEGKTLVGLLDERTILEKYLMEENASAVQRALQLDKLKNSEVFLNSVMKGYLGYLDERAGSASKPFGGTGEAGPQGDVMARLAEVMRAAKTGFSPTQPQELGAGVAAVQQARQLG